jgi:hypothetical protein
MNGGNLNNVRCETSKLPGIKERDCSEESLKQIVELIVRCVKRYIY